LFPDQAREPNKSIGVKTLGRVERFLLIAGLSLLAIYAAVRIHGILLSRAALRNFAAVQQPSSLNPPSDHAEQLAAAPPSFALWSGKRIKEYQESLRGQFSSAVAILRIPKIHLEAPVLEGTDDLTLNRGVGRIPGTARPGEEGNVGIAGHRDGFFRGLKDVSAGDSIDLVTPQGIKSYMIDRVLIVNPSDTSVLQPRTEPSLTLVTCYPFYFVGSAPQRYVVQAVLTDSPHKIAQTEGR
jgi:sortase A